jgi:hypothetical protein
VGEEWSDAEIRGFMERVTMERFRAKRRAHAERKQPRPLVSRSRRAAAKDVRRAASMVTKKKKAG